MGEFLTLLSQEDPLCVLITRNLLFGDLNQYCWNLLILTSRGNSLLLMQGAEPHRAASLRPNQAKRDLQKAMGGGVAVMLCTNHPPINFHLPWKQRKVNGKMPSDLPFTSKVITHPDNPGWCSSDAVMWLHFWCNAVTRRLYLSSFPLHSVCNMGTAGPPKTASLETNWSIS